MKTTIEQVSPAVAAKYLNMNGKNPRPFRESNGVKFVKLIESGSFYLSHQGIAFDVNGDLRDGQHRLWAIIKTGKTVQMSVTRDMSEDAAKGIDCGLVRANYDRTHLIDDYEKNRCIVQAVSIYIRFARHWTGAVPVNEIEDEFLARAASWEWMANTMPFRKKVIGRSGVLAAIAIYHSCDNYMATEFSDRFITGANLEERSPILALRNSLDRTASYVSANYWKTMAAIVAHKEGRRLTNITEATEDILGNKNSIRLIRARTQRGIKGGITRKANAGKLVV